MHQDLHADYRTHVIRNRRKRIIRKIVSVLGCLVVFCTTYALILPAITMENTAYCGVEEHTHTEACYRQNSSKVLVCTADSFGIHTHDAGCYGENGVILCGKADYLIHSHGEGCYDPDGLLVCALPERSVHVHTDACYAAGETQAPVLHVHSEACYTRQKGDLVCTQEEYEGHTHDSSCYAASRDLTCTLEENHVHGESCYTYPLQCTQSTDPHVHENGCYSTGNLLCSTGEGHFHGGTCFDTIRTCTSTEEGHAHDDSCYSSNLVCSIPENHIHDGSCYESVVVCGVEAGQAHAHGAECYSTQPEQICSMAENHVHDPACYRQDLDCEIAENPGHTHEDTCYPWNDVLSCGLEEGEPEPSEPAGPVLVCTEPIAQSHVHGEACFEVTEQENTPNCGMADEAHAHTAECYDLSCGLGEHTHEMACWSDPEADTETPAVWESSFAHLELTGNWNEDVIAIAESQLGYTESTRNYAVWEDGSIHGYTRYGAWYGVPHGDWCGMFASFCIYYADVKGMPLNYGVRPWIEDLTALKLYHEAEVYAPKTGDLIFYDWEGDGLSDHVGLVAEIIPATEYEPARVKAIEGNSSNCVQYVFYDINDPVILGYSELPENKELYFCGISGHIHNEYCTDGCGREEHVHTEACLTEAVLYYCGHNEHTHSEACLDAEGNRICGLEEHIHTGECLSEPVAYYCGKEAHTHSETCFDEANGLNCALDEHIHDDSCLTEPVTYYCGLREHTHSEECLDAEGNRICGFEEHIHEDPCLTEPVTYYCGKEAHTHSETCCSEAGELLCTLEEHTHTGECTAEPPVYYCGLEEHVHFDACYADGNLICTRQTHLHTETCLTEIIYYCGKESHTHEESCHDGEGSLTCTLEEHVHTGECTTEPVYYCGREAHTHGAACYDEEGDPICEIPEHTHTEACRKAPEYTCGLEAHTHGDECHDAEGNLICTIPEHIHGEDCMGYTCGMSAHSHDSGCYDAEGNLIGELDEHWHDHRCDNYICGQIPHTHSTACYDAAGSLICGREEHTHTGECLSFDLEYADEKITVTVTITGVEDLPEDVRLKVWPVAPEEDPAAYGSMSDAVRQQMATGEQFVSNVGIYEMQLLQDETVYTLSETAVVDVNVRFAEPLFTRDQVAGAEGMQAFTLTPDPDREYEYTEEPVEVEIPQEEIIDDTPSSGVPAHPVSAYTEDSGSTGIIQAVPLALRSWKEAFTRSHVAYALENPEDVAESGGEGREEDIPGSQTSKTPAYNAEAAEGEDITNTNVGITGVSFRSTSVGAFAVALTSETVTGNYWLRVNRTSELTSGGTYMIVSSDGNYALSVGSNNYRHVQIQAVKGNEQYFTISDDTDSSIKWTITADGSNYTVYNAAYNRYLRITKNDLLSGSSGTVKLSSGTYSNDSYGPFWIFSNSSRMMYNEGGKFKSSTNLNDDDYEKRQTRNMLIFKLVNTTLTVPSDVAGSASAGTAAPGTVKDPNPYQTFTDPGEKQVGEDKTAVTDDTVTVTGSYYSDAPTSDIEWEFRIHTGNQKADFEAHQANDGKVLTDKSVIYGDDAYGAFNDSDPNTFSVTLSTLGQAYQLPQQDLEKVPVDVVFVLDVSGSMKSNNRIKTLVNAVNASMTQIMEANGANRVGIALYSSGSMELLPLDRYTADNNAYIRYETKEDGSVTGGILTTSTLKNSDGTSFGNLGKNEFDGLGTFTQAGIASGYEIFEAIKQGEDNNKGTRYTVTVGEGENVKTYTVNRQPVFVLVTDGEPTHCTNVYNDPLNGPYYGNGLSNANPDSPSCNAKGVMGYYTVLTANYYKRMIGIHYDTPALFYTIGMGIGETGSLDVDDNSEKDGYKRAVLNPAVINAGTTTSAVRYADTTLNMMRALLDENPGSSYDDDYITVGRNNNACGAWVYDLNGDVPVLKDHPYDSDYAYATEAFFGELDEDELEEIFDKILASSTTTNPYGFILYEAKNRVELVDNIGEGMEIKGLQNNEDGSVNELAPQLLYGSNRYAPTSVTTENGVTTISYEYDGVPKDISGRTADLSEIKVSVTTDADGNQTLTMLVPDTELPVYIPDSTASFYYEALPVRLIYQVGLTAESEQAVLNLRNTGGELTFYANRWDEGKIATSVLLPHEENPYYFDPDAKPDHNEPKAENTTGTYADAVSCSIAEYETTVTNTHLLGNNGKLVFRAEVMDIPVEKSWTDVPETETLPKQVELTLYKVTKPETAGAVPTAEVVKTLLLKGTDSPAWKGRFEAVAIPDETWYYAIAETPVDGFKTTYTGGDTITISVDDPETEDGTRIQIQAARVTVTVEEDAATAGAITVDNRYIWNYALPKTGGAGVGLYYVTGALLCTAAAVWSMNQANNKKTKKERG